MFLKQIQIFKGNFVYFARTDSAINREVAEQSSGIPKKVENNDINLESEVILEAGERKLENLVKQNDKEEENTLEKNRLESIAKLTKDADALKLGISTFRRKLQQFEDGKKNWSTFLRGNPWIDDDQTENINRDLGHLKKQLHDVLDRATGIDPQTADALWKQKEWLYSVEIDRPNLWNATGGLLAQKIGERVAFETKDVVAGMILDPASKAIKNSTKKIPILGTLANVVSTVTLDLSSGLVEGAGELVNGFSVIIAHPTDTLKGMASLVGRDPNSKEWSTKNAGNAWKSMALSTISYEHFEKGEIGKGIAKAGLNVIMTATGIGAASKAAQAGSIAYRVAKTAGEKTARAAGRATVTGTSVFAIEFASGITALPGEAVATVGKIISVPSRLVRGSGKLRSHIKAIDAQLASLTTSIDSFTINGQKASRLENILSLSPDELQKLSPEKLAALGVSDSVSIQEFLNLKELITRRQKLQETKRALVEQYVKDRAEANKKEVVREQTEGLRKKERKLFEEAYVDPATGLMNRSGLNYLKQMLSKNKRASIVSFDSDHFRAINDVCGSEFGDSMIQIIGNNFHEIQKSLRRQGHEVHAVRMGGEEFVLFGDAPKHVMAAAMEEAAAAIKKEIRSQLSQAQMDQMANQIFTSKYASDPNGLQRAYNEIGGSTSGVSEVQIHGPTDPAQIARQSLQLTDELLERGKNKTGRGKIYIDENSPLDSGKRANNLVPENALSSTQNAILDDVAAGLKDRIRNQQSARTPLTTAILDRFESGSPLRNELESFFEVPPVDMKQAEALSNKTGIPIGDLRSAKLESISAAHDYGTYTGAATMRKLQGAGKEFQLPRRIEIGEFKSINETMGHTHGDTFLMWVYQDVITPALEATNIPPGQIIVAQKGANFHYRLHSAASHLQAKFEAALRTNYEKNLQSFFDRMNTRGIKDYRTIREDWIRKNKFDRASQSLEDSKTLIIK